MGVDTSETPVEQAERIRRAVVRERDTEKRIREMDTSDIVALIHSIEDANAQLERERDEALKEAADYSISAAAGEAIRELLNHHKVPLAAFIDDHVGNAIAQRDAATAALAKAEGERDRAAAELRDISYSLASARVGYYGDHTAKTITFNEAQEQRIRAALTPAPETVSMSTDEQRTLHSALRRSVTIIAPEAPKDGE